MQHYKTFQDSGSVCKDIERLLTGETFDTLFCLYDENTYKHCSFSANLNPELQNRVRIFTVPPGESSKSLHRLNDLWTFMLENEATRHSALINTGGGMICDLGGMAASTFKRGIPFIHMPTTLLAMTDAAFGGKNGINVNGLKNQAGTFTPPYDTWIYPGFLKTLPPRELKSGLAEMIKHGLMLSDQHWGDLKKLSPEEPALNESLICTSIDIKCKLIEEDYRETGKRKLLNFGHTVGHGLEAVMQSKDYSLLHGEAVAAGMIIESWIAAEKGILKEGDAIDISQTLSRFFNPVKPDQDTIKDVIRAMYADKKNKGSAIFFALPEKPGSGVYDIEATEDEINKAFQKYKQFKCVTD